MNSVSLSFVQPWKNLTIDGARNYGDKPAPAAVSGGIRRIGAIRGLLRHYHFDFALRLEPLP
jgi:hypothetical protein